MDILIFIPLLYLLCTMRISVQGCSEYIGREQTGAIKGIFAVAILYQHMRSYLLPEAAGMHNAIFNGFLDLLGQLIVVMFLFYSGYGVMCALRRNAKGYLSNFFTHRIVKVWLMFAIAVGLFYILDVILGIKYSASTVFLSVIGWESIGNSNWFMFDILALYMFTYLSMKITCRWKLDLRYAMGMILCLSLLLILFLKAAGKGAWWQDTVLAYPVGMLFGIYKERIETFVSGWRWFPAFVSVAGLFVLGYAVNRYGIGGG